MHNVLVPVDGSDSAMRALAWAIQLTKRIGDATIHLVHVSEKLQPEASVAILSRAEGPLRGAQVRYTTQALNGPAASVIAEHAGRLGCDAIVMGTRGLSAIDNLVLGSVANEVVHLTRLPVTLVK